MQDYINKNWQFLEDELKADTEAFEQKFLTPARTLLFESEEMFVGMFIGFRGGEMLVKFPNTRSIPRKREYLYCMLLPSELRDIKNWGTLTYEDLYTERYKGTEAVCLWHEKSDDPRCSLVGFSEVETDFANMIKETSKLILVFAPKRPPIEYLANLQSVVKDEFSMEVTNILCPKTEKRAWMPKLIRDESPDLFIYNKVQDRDIVILQGPPGTGKTHLIAQLCEKYTGEGKSVMVTALTNRALMEVAEKKALKELLNEGRVLKTNTTANEMSELPLLRRVDRIYPIKGAVILATYYMSSKYAASMEPASRFDVLIMDEASQAFTAMFAAANKMGVKKLWVGDTNQLSPIVELRKERILQSDYQCLIDGMQYVADFCNEPVYQLTSTWRFGKRASMYTGLFYNNSLQTHLASHDIIVPSSLKDILHPNGGPAIVKMNLTVGDVKPRNAIDYIVSVIKDFLFIKKDIGIAVLAHQVRTVNELQISLTRSGINSKDIIVDTVARVQGLTTDVVIYLVVNSSYQFSLEPKLFNVATSRARQHTILVTDNNIINEIKDPTVREYFQKLEMGV